MALSIVSSNRVEILQQNLSHRICSQMLSNPFDPDVIVVPTFAMARWLNLKIAQQQGIAANIEYPLPSAWIWQLATTVLKDTPKIDPLSRDAMGWKIFHNLPTLINHAEFETISRYLKHDTSGIKRWQLSTRIADVFERYQHYRPDMIRLWSNGLENHWQALLWRVLIENQTKQYHSVVLDQLLLALNTDCDTACLPERISLFVLSSLPPRFIDLIHALAKRTTVTLYLHSPTDQYWADLKNQKSQLRLRLLQPQQVQYYEAGNELLTSWGRQGQTMQDLLLDNNGLVTNEADVYQPPDCSTLLQSIQRSIFNLDDSAVEMLADDSLSVHICHSPMRECQVLHDELLRLMQKDSALKLEDILVMVPDISRYAPYIEAAFQTSDNKTQPTLAWNISDITLADEHPLILTFLQLLKLPQSRFSLSEVLSLLDIDEVKNRFDLDEQALHNIRSLLDDAQIRWAIDAQHKQQLGLPPTIENTWQQAKDRLFAGYAMPGDDYWNGISALSQVQGDRALHIGKFWHLFERLQHWRKRLTQPQNSHDWQTSLLSLVDEFFLESNSNDGRLQHIRDVIAELGNPSLSSGINSNDNNLSSELVNFWMEQQLASQEKPGRLFSGGVTFCGMRPMRCLPFGVICLLGMNDGDFPRRDSRVDFDLMNHSWKPGDPLKGDEDRYLMLETLLCARKALYISYCGRSLKDNGECMPSVLVRELLDFVDLHFKFNAVNEASMSQHISTTHPMQAFSKSNFLLPLQGYNQYWCDIANQLARPKSSKPTSDWSKQTLIPLVKNTLLSSIDLLHLCRFLKHPIEYFFRQRLKIYFNSTESAIDEETFDLTGLNKWHIRQRLLYDYLNQVETSHQHLSAAGLLPHGPAANTSIAGIADAQKSLLLQLQPYYGEKAETRHIALSFNSDVDLNGSVENYYSKLGLMEFTSSKLQGKHFLSLWVKHLAMCATQQLNKDETSCLISSDQTLIFSSIDADEAHLQLAHYVDLFQQGAQVPLAIFPAASYAFAKSFYKQGDTEKSMVAAYKGWQSNGWGDYSSDDVDDAYVKLAMRNNLQDPLTSSQFQDHAQVLYRLALSKGGFS
ncbi:MAG: exodeoxyribonuclease V gamma subunit [Candidatus Azotimanducaceae bacterium]|jgi:exodeoxyribonuclease V gamma subunit